MKRLHLARFGEDAVKPKHNCYRWRYPDHVQNPICICPCHGVKYHLNSELAEWFGRFIEGEI